MIGTVSIIIEVFIEKIRKQKIGDNHEEYHLKNHELPQIPSEDGHVSESIVVEEENRAENLHECFFMYCRQYNGFLLKANLCTKNVYKEILYTCIFPGNTKLMIR